MPHLFSGPYDTPTCGTSKWHHGNGSRHQFDIKISSHAGFLSDVNTEDESIGMHPMCISFMYVSTTHYNVL